MATIWLDDMAYYSTAELPLIYTVNTNAATFTVDATGGPFGDGCINRLATSSDTTNPGSLGVQPLYYQGGVWSQQAYGYLGGYFYVDDIAKSAGTVSNVLNQVGTFLTVLNGSLANFCVGLNSNGTFTLYRVGTALATSLAAIISATWLYLEVGWFLSQGSNGWVEIRVNSNVILRFDGRTSPEAGDMFPFQPPPPFYNSFRFLGMSSLDAAPRLNVKWSSMYTFDGVASADPSNPCNTFLGPKQIKHIVTDGAGDQTNWTPLSAPNWSQVNAIPPLGDAAYVETASAGTRDTYNYENVVGNPVAIMVAAYLRKTTSAAGNWSNIFRQNGTDHDGPVHGLGGTSFNYVFQPYDTNPATGLRYTETEMNDGQWGPLS